MWFVCFEFVMGLEGTERTAKLLLGGNTLFSKLEIFSGETSEKMQRKWARPVFFALTLLTI